MEKSEIIKAFLDKGLQVTADVLDFFTKNPQKMDLFFSKPIDYPPTITLDFIEKVLEPFSGVIKTSAAKKKVDVNNFVNYFNKRYIFLSNILKKRLDLPNLISINKISERIKKFSIIGMVKEKEATNKTIVLEDMSSEIKVTFPENLFSQLIEDETVGVVCKKENSVVFGEKLIFPDIPLQRGVNKTEEDNYIFFISDLHMDSELFNKKSYEKLITWLENQQEKLNIFIIGDISSNKKDIVNFLSIIPKIHETYVIKGETDNEIDINILPNPTFFQKENLKLFLFHNPRINEYINFWNTPEQTIINLIKKRHLDPVFSLDSKIYDNDPYLLNAIPDVIVAAHTHIPSVTNYKGITIITTGSFVTQPIFWLMNLRTRETFKIDFS